MNLIAKTVLAGLSPLIMSADISTTNLLTNPGAESGLTGWSSYLGARTDAGTFDPGINPLSGSYDFSGGLGGYSFSELYQTDGILTQGVTSADVTAGLYANVSFNEQSLNQGAPSDTGRIALAFLNASGGYIVPANAVDTYYNVTPEVYSIGAWRDQTEAFLNPRRDSQDYLLPAVHTA